MNGIEKYTCMNYAGLLIKIHEYIYIYICIYPYNLIDFPPILRTIYPPVTILETRPSSHKEPHKDLWDILSLNLRVVKCENYTLLVVEIWNSHVMAIHFIPNFDEE